MRYALCCLLLLMGTGYLWGQETFSRADSLRGKLTPLRTCYDVSFYDLEIKLDPDLQRLAGRNRIHFLATRTFDKLQLDLFANLDIAEIKWRDQVLSFTREHNAVFVQFPVRIKKGNREMIEIWYAGEPRKAQNPPWDGGLVWRKDQNKRHWIGVACEGLGASSWWPLKDHLSDEPDSMQFSIIYPEGAKVVANGQLRALEKLPGNFRRWVYFVNNPINSYNVSFYIGDYVKFTDVYQNASGLHELTYHVLSYNLDKAKGHFEQVKDMLFCFEKYFGEYPFWEDGFKLVETSYWGMEHQSAIAYGNNYRNNPFDFDFIIIHESGHEWFGNSLSVADHADMWIHESFTTYTEAVYVEHYYGYERMIEYLNTQKPLIKNLRPIQGPREVNFDAWPAADMYYKGSWMLHTLRNAVGDDDRFFATLKAFAEEHKLTILDTEKVVDYFSWKLGEDYSWLFAQYLNYTSYPVLEYKLSKKRRRTNFSYRWVADVEDFGLPLEVSLEGQTERLYPTTQWQTMIRKGLSEKEIEFNPNWGLYEVKKVDK